MTDIFGVLDILYRLWIVVALIGILLAIRLRVKNMSLKNKNEGDARFFEAMLLKNEDSFAAPGMKKPGMANMMEVTFEYQPFFADSGIYIKEGPLIDKNYIIALDIISGSTRPNISTYMGMGQRSTAGLRSYGYKTGIMTAKFPVAKGYSPVKIGQIPTQSRDNAPRRLSPGANTRFPAEELENT